MSLEKEVEEEFFSPDNSEVILVEKSIPLDDNLKDTVFKIWKVIYSGVLIPDNYRDHPYRKHIILASCVLFILLPIKIYIVIFILGIIVGFSWFIPLDQHESSALKAIKQRYDDLLQRTPIDKSDQETIKPTASKGFTLTKRIDSAMNKLLDKLVESVIDPWYMPQNKSGQKEFQSCVRSSIDVALVNLVRTIRSLEKDAMTLYLYGLTNALIVHMQEYKLFESLSNEQRLSSSEFLASPQARRVFFGSTPMEVNHLKQIVSVILRRLFPKQESTSIILTSLLKEVLASGALWNMMDRCCDPDFINMKIVEALQSPTDIILPPGWSMVIVKGIKIFIC